jgi:hypothetical protein
MPRITSHSRTETKGPASVQESATDSQEEKTRRDPGSDSPANPSGANEPLRLVHHHAGYLRVRAAAFLQPDENSPIVTAARTAAEAVPGFRSWSLNPKTGSVVIEYEPGALEPDDLLKHIGKGAGLRVEVATSRKMTREELVSSFLDKVQGANQTVNHLTGGRADLRELTPAALAVVSVISFIVNDERSRLPHWMSALYRGYRIFMHWHRPEVRTRERTARQEEERNAADQSGFSQ